MARAGPGWSGTTRPSGRRSGALIALAPPRGPVDPGPGGADVVLIVALAPGRVIGAGGRLPWKLPEDLKRFKESTMGHPLVMGRKTFESLGRPLPGRTSIVVTRRADAPVPEGVRVARSPLEGLRLAASLDRRVFVIGGAELYAGALPHATEVLATLVYHPFPGDAFFPRLDAGWHVASRDDLASARSSLQPATLDYSVVRLVRRSGDDGCALCRLRAGQAVPMPRQPTPWDLGFARLLADLAEPTP